MAKLQTFKLTNITLAKRGYVFGSVCLSATLVSNITQSYEWIAMKFYGGVSCGTRRKLNFCGDLGFLRRVYELKTP